MLPSGLCGSKQYDCLQIGRYQGMWALGFDCIVRNIIVVSIVKDMPGKIEARCT